MARSVKVSGADNKASEGGGTFEPLAAGVYNVTVFDHQVKQYNNGANAGRDYLALQLRISDGQKGANRRVFVNVGDFPKWAPKNGKEANNFLFFQFYKALGVEFPDGDDITEVDLPDYEELNGSPLAARLKIVEDDYAFKKAQKEGTLGDRTKADFLKNEVAAFLETQDEDSLVQESSGESDEFDL